jgi:hypothetical protein
MWGAVSAVLTLMIGAYCVTAMVMAVVLGCNGNPLDSLQAAGPASSTIAADNAWAGLSVIGAGLERTGTESLQEALHLMDLGPAYSFLILDSAAAQGFNPPFPRNRFRNPQVPKPNPGSIRTAAAPPAPPSTGCPVSPARRCTRCGPARDADAGAPLRAEHARLWREAADDAGRADWRRIFRGYTTAVDPAAALAIEDLVAAFPAARVILTVRSNASTWRASWRAANCHADHDWAARVAALAGGAYGRAQLDHLDVMARLWHRLDPHSDPSVCLPSPTPADPCRPLPTPADPESGRSSQIWLVSSCPRDRVRVTVSSRFTPRDIVRAGPAVERRDGRHAPTHAETTPPPARPVPPHD